MDSSTLRRRPKPAESTEMELEAGTGVELGS